MGSIILQASRFSSHLKLSLKWAQFFSDCSKLRSLGDLPVGAGWSICAEREGKEESRDEGMG